MTAERSGISLTEEDAAIVKAMLLRGDRQHDIAAWFGVNGGRIADIKTRKRFRNVRPAEGKLPPQGPYLSGRSSQAARVANETAMDELDKVKQRLDELLRSI